MNKKQIIEAAKSLSISEIDYLQIELSKLKKAKAESKQRIKRTILLARTDFHPVCYTWCEPPHRKVGA